MSAPETNIEKQKKRNRPSLIGIAAAGAIAALALIALSLWSGVPLDEQSAPDVKVAQ